MNTRIRRLTAISLLTCLSLGGFSASASEEEATSEATDALTKLHSANIERAREANDQAVDEALSEVLESTRLDLDIRLLDRKSKTVAAAN